MIWIFCCKYLWNNSLDINELKKDNEPLFTDTHAWKFISAYIFSLVKFLNEMKTSHSLCFISSNNIKISNFNSMSNFMFFIGQNMQIIAIDSNFVKQTIFLVSLTLYQYCETIFNCKMQYFLFVLILKRK